MLDINVDVEVEKLYKALLKIEEKQKKKNHYEIVDFSCKAMDRCLRGRYAR